ncbi:lasso peptide biosynthesis B2 protein [Streptomyces jumonjinensis]|uniref:lasso peptide biosynthesis B2 protein n=1 Tax=Streptomyces jumonjinensis TaxID=1945 RepID=UPI0037B5B012
MRHPVPDEHTRTALTGEAGVIVNYRTGETVVLTGGALARRLVSLESSAAPAPVPVRTSELSWGTHESPARLEPPAPPPWPFRLAAMTLLVTTLVVRQFGRRRTRFGRLVRLAETGKNLPPASSEYATLVVRSVRWAARALPARIACLEESTAAALLLAAGGRGRAWRHGIATDPIRLHAWICDMHGRPIEEPVQTGHYTPINEPEFMWKRNR